MTAVLENPTAIAAETAELTVEVYSKPGCVQCNATYRKMDKEHLAYEVTDMSQDADALDRVRALGHMQAPVTIVLDAAGRNVDNWSGFRPDKIEEYAARLPKVA